MQKKYTLYLKRFYSAIRCHDKTMSSLLLSFLFIAFTGNAYAQNFGWAKRLGGADYEHGHSIAIDVNGNIYSIGEFRGTADFDPGPATYNLTSFSPCCFDIYVSKLDAAGNFVWAKQLGGTDGDGPAGVTTDAAGNVYVTGSFNGTADFDPGVAEYNFTSAGSTDIFILKLDAAGNFIWAKQMGGPTDIGAGSDLVRAIAVDVAGNVYTTGRFFGTSDFDPGAGVYNLSTNDMFEDDVFISKLDVNGNFLWAKQFIGLVNQEAYGLAVDGNGNVYSTGIFYNTTDFDPGPGVFNLTTVNESSFQNYDIYISKLDANGNFVWAKQLGGPHITGSSSWDNSWGIAVDVAGNVYTTGSFPGTADFDPGPGVYNMTAVSANGLNIFISKLDTDGNFVWAKQMGGSLTATAYAIAVDAMQNVYTTGYFAGDVDFDPGAAVYDIGTTGGGADLDIFISKLDKAGNFLWAQRAGGISTDLSYSIAVDASGNVVTTGTFANTADFDPGVNHYNLESAGVDDIFILKLVSSALPVTLMNFAATVNDKNIVDISWATTSEINNNYFTIERSKDALSFEKLINVKGAVNSSTAINYQAADINPYMGKSYYRLRQTDLDGRYTYSAVVQVQINSTGDNGFTIYPNPVKDVLQLQLHTAGNSKQVWQVQDATGKIIKQQTGQSRTINQSIDVAGLPSGIYYLVLNNEKNAIVKKFIKQ